MLSASSFITDTLVHRNISGQGKQSKIIEPALYSNSIYLYQNLYQNNPLEFNPLGTPKSYKSWTLSLESYQKSAKREYDLLLYNQRRTIHEVRINHWEVYSPEEINEIFQLIKDSLRANSIIAYSVIEITRDKYSNPSNKIHRHFLVDSDSMILSEQVLREVFKTACIYSGLRPDQPFKNCEVKYRPVPDLRTDRDQYGNLLTPEQAFKKRVKYILKYAIPTRAPILFQQYIGINKIDRVGKWFSATKEKMYDNLLESWYPEQAVEKLLQKIIKHMPQVRINHSTSVQIGNQSYQWGNGGLY